MRRFVPLLLALVLTAASCGGGDDKDEAAPPRSTTSTTAAAPAGDDGAVPAGASPLTALPIDPGAAGRPALVVKIDNAPKARPQAGVNAADVVVVEKVEDGVTRFFAIFHSSAADPVGPVRSARTTDIELAAPLNRPLFAYAGTNATFQRLVDAAPLVDVGIDKASGDYRRQRGRPAPYNLFTDTTALHRRAPEGAGPPPQLFRFRAAGAPVANQGATPASSLHVEYIGDRVRTIVDYAWDAGAGGYRRTQDGSPHVDAAGAQISPTNVIVQFVNYKDTGQRDQSNTVVPEAELTGSGEAWVLTGGQLVKGTWSKPSREAVTTYSDAAGRPILLAPGRTWVELAPPGQASTG